MLKRFLIFTLAITLITICETQAEQSAWTANKLNDFLQKGNNTEGIHIRQLIISQTGRDLTWYKQIGNEEQRTQLHKRPVLESTNPLGPFVRGKDLTVLVDRQFGMKLQLTVDLFHASRETPSKFEILPIQKAYAYLDPGKDEEILLNSKNGHFIFDIPQHRHCQFLRIQVRSGDERHEITISFLNRKKPVSFLESQ